MTLEDLATVRQLMERTGKSEQEALALLRKLRVPVTLGTFSDRLFMQRLEHGGRDQGDALDAACANLARHGFVVQDVTTGRPNVLRVTVTEPLLIGSREFSSAPSEGAWARILVNPGEVLVCLLQIARKRPNRTADFNVRFDRQRNDVTADLHLFYLASEDLLWVFKAAELEALRKNPTFDLPRKAGDRPLSFFPIDKQRRTWRLAFGKGSFDADIDYRVEKIGTPGQGTP